MPIFEAVGIGGGVGVGVDGFDVGEALDGVDGGGISGKQSLIHWTTLSSENHASSSSLSQEMEDNELFSTPLIPR